MTGPRRRVALAALTLLLALPGLARSQSALTNPVLPGDYPDPTVVRAGGVFYASATSASWAPSFPVFRSRDLVRWTRVGSVLATPPAWTNGNYWAPELVRWSGRFYAFYSASRRGGRPCLGVAVAARGEGPWTDKGPVMCKAGGTIDVDPFTDADGSHWLLFKNMGTGNGLAARRFSLRRLRTVGREHALLGPGARWEQGVTEGPDLVRRGGNYYLFYGAGALPAAVHVRRGRRAGARAAGSLRQGRAQPAADGQRGLQMPRPRHDGRPRRPGAVPPAPRLRGRRRARRPALRPAVARRLRRRRPRHRPAGRVRPGAPGRRRHARAGGVHRRLRRRRAGARLGVAVGPAPRRAGRPRRRAAALRRRAHAGLLRPSGARRPLHGPRRGRPGRRRDRPFGARPRPPAARDRAARRARARLPGPPATR